MEKIKRLRFNEEAMKVSLLRLKKAEQNHQDNEVYQSVAETLLWVETTKEWHTNINKKSYFNYVKEKPIIKSTKLPYNLVKHNMDFVKFHQLEGGFNFPFTFPMEIRSFEAIWIDVDDNLHEKYEGIYETHVRNYKNFLEGENIYKTMSTTSDLLLKLGKNLI